MQSQRLSILIILLLVLNACSKDDDERGCRDYGTTPTESCPSPFPPAPEATTPEILFDNLARALRTRDENLYESLIDRNYWFTETNCLGEILFENDYEEEITILGGSRDGSIPGIFDIFRDFAYDLHLLLRSQELGSEFLGTFDGDPDGHPDEDWEVFRGRVQMLMLDEHGDGYRVEQIMTFKSRLDEDIGLWKIIRWIDDPLGSDCGTSGKIAVGESSSW
ncbi:MAG: hypothetical protein OXH63_22020, partial [Gemmatimonadetes bacterium]|nr:hypothetical protein [Gemmatimonadota bacterium]